MADTFDAYVAYWYENDLPQNAKAVENLPRNITCSAFRDHVFSTLQVVGGRFWAKKDEWQLFAFAARSEDDSLRNARFHRYSDLRITPIDDSRASGLSLSGRVDLDYEHLFFIIRPMALTANGELPKSKLSLYVRLSSSFEPRLELMEILWKRIKERQIVHIRAPPASGKSTLATQFQRYISWIEPALPNIYISWPPSLNTVQPFNKVLFAHDPEFFAEMRSKDAMATTRYVLIVDEAQSSYTKQDFWIDFIKRITDGTERERPYVLLLSSFGSPTMVPVRHPDSTPAMFEPARRMSIQPSEHFPVGLYFTSDEFESFFQGFFCENEEMSGNQYAEYIDKTARRYIYELTSGHPGLCRAICSIIGDDVNIRKLIKRGASISESQVREVLTFPGLLGAIRASPHWHCLKRAIPDDNAMQKPSMMKVVKTIMRDGSAPEPPGLSAGEVSELMALYKEGFLQSDLDGNDKTVYVIPTRFHFLLYENFYNAPSSTFPHHEIPTLLDLCKKAITNFSSYSTLASRGDRDISIASRHSPPETQLHDEFYRACHHILGDIFLTSEWMSSGRIDFIVASKKWGIALLQNGTNLAEHLSRFKPGGGCWEAIQNGGIREFVVLDFTDMHPTSGWPEPFLYRICSSNEHAGFKMYNHRPEVIHTGLLRNRVEE